MSQTPSSRLPPRFVEAGLLPNTPGRRLENSSQRKLTFLCHQTSNFVATKTRLQTSFWSSWSFNGKALVLISVNISAVSFTKLALFSLCISVPPFPTQSLKCQVGLSALVPTEIKTWIPFVGAARPKSHCMLFDSNLDVSLVIIVLVFLCYLRFMSFFPTSLLECPEPDPGFLGINNKCFKAFRALAKYHYLEICWHLI